MPARMEEHTTITEEYDDQSSVKSDESCGARRVKFLCRYGGRILPRPGDGKLRYAGGGTRVVAFGRNISFADLIANMSKVYGSAVLLKCQLPGEDLDTLVSVKSDEDLANMLEEYDRVGVKEGLSKVRAFLFPLPISAGAEKPPAACRTDSRPSTDAGIFHSVKPQDDSHVSVSIPHHNQISQWQSCLLAQKHLPNQLSPRRFHPNQHQQHLVPASAMNGRAPRGTGVHSDSQYNSSVGYIQWMQVKHKLGGGGSHPYVDDSQSASRMVPINNSPRVWVQ